MMWRLTMQLRTEAACKLIYSVEWKNMPHPDAQSGWVLKEYYHERGAICFG
jgi:hypothetical protein